MFTTGISFQWQHPDVHWLKNPFHISMNCLNHSKSFQDVDGLCTTNEGRVATGEYLNNRRHVTTIKTKATTTKTMIWTRNNNNKESYQKELCVWIMPYMANDKNDNNKNNNKDKNMDIGQERHPLLRVVWDGVFSMETKMDNYNKDQHICEWKSAPSIQNEN